MIFDRIRQLMLFAVGVSLPTENLNVVVAGLPLTPNKVVNLPLIAMAGVLWAVQPRRRPVTAKDVWVLFFALSVGVSAIGGFLQKVPPQALFNTCLTWVALVIFYFVLTYVVSTRQDVDTLIRGIAVGIMIVVASALLGFGVQADTIYGERMSGQGGNANMFAFNLVLAFPMVLALLFSTRSPIGRLSYTGAVIIAVGGIMVSLSRSAYLSMATMIVFFLVRFRRPQYAVPMLIAVVVAVVLAPESVFNRLSTLSAEGPSDASAQKRLDMLGPVFRAFLTNPLVGIGLLRFVPFTFEQGFDVHGVIHNAFLQVAAEQGLLGLIPFTSIVWLAWRDYGRSWRLAQRMRSHRDREMAALALRALLLQMSLTGTLVMSLFQPTMRHKGLWILFAISTVLLALVRKRAQELAAGTVPATPQPGAPMGAPGAHPARV